MVEGRETMHKMGWESSETLESSNTKSELRLIMTFVFVYLSFIFVNIIRVKIYLSLQGIIFY